MKLLTVYVPMSADIIHPGHVHLLNEAQKQGQVTVGLLSDDAICAKKGRLPVMSYDERYCVVSHIIGVKKVVKQASPDYRPNLLRIKPDYVVHGDDWSKNTMKTVSEFIAEWHGKLIVMDYSSSPIASSIIKQRVLDQLSNPSQPTKKVWIESAPSPPNTFA
jgi:phosphoenolpyruvate phosphomutase / 2-hydroxyethylphosphonate cytidylyltransferase